MHQPAALLHEFAIESGKISNPNDDSNHHHEPRFQPSSNSLRQESMIKMSAATLLTLPPELQFRIMALVLRSNDIHDFEEQNGSFEARPNPFKNLISRLRSAAINKALFAIALPAYFLQTQLNMVVGIRLGYARADPWGARVTEVYGTFEEHPLFFENTIKLRVEVREMDVAVLNTVAKVLGKCRSLVDVTVCVGNLWEGEEEKFFEHVVRAVMDGKAPNRKVKIKQESAAAYKQEMAVKGEAHMEAYQRKRDAMLKHFDSQGDVEMGED